MSGLALRRYQRDLSALRAIEDCVRACARSMPERNSLQLTQLQFHCGKPPPAPEPSTLTRTSRSSIS
jgi:hypothetical protein